ncbi:peptidoglycan DD-metalloendopeptidase family protein [Pseudomarimonas salicorniae]|uniref:Peptidoglycan DD-metalloendopeptidase family protein n=1 Tax=Pseudomarimonas salicorniae TaxID=2933270 RepID=A0ABT0GFF4_9GAMM|nr:peptidoglycan DD-metalloendopeptidase family protein [Lysobacter sp. CAU 1642]MCK7593275.1 peptidoglycan DD-metalloendopeptidase family protein [Lysobacter sp. CAU 1642]
MSPVGRALLLALLCGLLSACAPQRSVRVEPSDRPQPRGTPTGLYEVVRGDTLYGIAFRHGMDYRELASMNGIGPPYTIYPGQRLRLSAGTTAQPTAPARPTREARGVIAPIVAEQPARPASGSTPPPTARPQPPPGAPPSSAPVTGTPAPVTPSVTPSLPAGPPRWQWPAEGQIVSRYLAGDPTRQGVNLAGRGGDPVRAAADGVVVYSGSGLIGYGELIIVKHDETWLSAYGHNRKRLVNEGEAVRGGQQIAELGRTGTSRDMLHFEVRRNGRPVDPLGVLPKR